MHLETDGAVHVTRWQGREDFARFAAAPMRMVAGGEEAFAAERRSVDTGGLDLQAWQLPAISGQHPATHPDSSTVRIDFIQHGFVRYELDSRTVEATAGTAHLLPCSAPIPFTIARSCQLTRLVLDGGLLPRSPRTQQGRTFGPIPPSRLLRALTLLVEQLLDSSEPIDTNAATAPAVQKLAWALLTDRTLSGELPLREQILLHIADHLSDPYLSPSSIAKRFGISLRWVHRVFTTEHTTISHYIRQQRCIAIGDRLRLDPQPVRVGVLAAEYGFVSSDQLARAFKTHYGSTIADYRTSLLLDGDPHGARGRDSTPGLHHDQS